MAKEYNIAFIDGQNLHLGTSSENWKVDFNKFRIYLKDKYNIREIYFFLGFLSEDEQDLYTRLQKSGYILVFREHSSEMKGKKKGNVDVDIVFEIMKRIIEEKNFDKIILISGDGDYIKPVKYLIEKNLFKKILFPNNKYSSLYKQIDTKYRNNLSLDHIKNKIEYKKK
ncbi:MAG: NYN domain-containing protein [Candidatus Gracilibacteria bacterium]|nr:NYN domain-containing protein [Candidatus Gracilibacteria bacterium]